MGKTLRVTFDSGHVYELPAQVVAADRAEYYAELDAEDDNIEKSYDEVYEEELAFALDDHPELHDWFLNNMNWSDVEGDAELVETPSFDPETALRNQKVTTSFSEE